MPLLTWGDRRRDADFMVVNHQARIELHTYCTSSGKVEACVCARHRALTGRRKIFVANDRHKEAASNSNLTPLAWLTNSA